MLFPDSILHGALREHTRLFRLGRALHRLTISQGVGPKLAGRRAAAVTSPADCPYNSSIIICTDGDSVGAKPGPFLSGLDEHREVFGRLAGLAAVIEEAADLIQATLARSGKLLLCGNGGSAADGQHIAAELTGRFVKDRRPLAAVALSTDTSALTSIANDYSFDEVFSRQVMGLGQRGDCLLGISTSGNSRNIIRAAEAARAAGIHVIGLLGRDGGALRALCDVAIVVPSGTTARIQEAHVFIGHTLCALVEEALGLS
jgi:D-sedoheptulose 7-phosphate isomerase